MAELAHGAQVPVHEGNPRGDALERAAQKEVVRASQDDGVRRPGEVRREDRPQGRLRRGVVQVARLHALDKAPALHGHGALAVERHQALELLHVQRRGRGQHQDLAAVQQRMGGLERRLHADDGQGEGLPQLLCRRGRGRVAGDDQGLDVALQELVHHAAHAGADLLRGL